LWGMAKIFFFLCAITMVSSFGKEQSSVFFEEFNLEDGYLKTKRPQQLSFKFTIKDIVEVDTDKHKISFSILTYINWHEPQVSCRREVFPGKQICRLAKEQMWTPTLRIRALSEAHVEKVLGSEDNILILHNTTQTIQQVFVLDVTITCSMKFKAFPFDSQSCPFEVLDIERPPVDFFSMVTSTVGFTDWPRPFSPTVSGFDYETMHISIRIWVGTLLLLGSA